MFSMAVEFLPTAKLAQRMPLLQHLVAMAVVHGIKTIPGYQVGEGIIILYKQWLPNLTAKKNSTVTVRSDIFSME